MRRIEDSSKCPHPTFTSKWCEKRRHIFESLQYSIPGILPNRVASVSNSTELEVRTTLIAAGSERWL